MTRHVLTIIGPLLLACTFAVGHESRPLFVQIEEDASGAVCVKWRVPIGPSLPGHPVPVLPRMCETKDEEISVRQRDSTLYKQCYHCAQSLAGETLSVRHPVLNPGLSTLFRIQLASGAIHSRILPPYELQWRVPDDEAGVPLAWDYARLGIRHIWEGVDHLLFVVCLLLLSRSWRRTLLTISGFTVAHSVTLLLCVLGLVPVAAPPIEAAIALSIVVVAAEIARGTQDSITRKYPVAVASAFGLLHGLGFATVLVDIGLPQTEVVVSLLSFNVGIEVGQIAFVGLFWIALRLTNHLRASEKQTEAFFVPFERGLIYPVGILAAFWTLQRASGFLL